MKLDWRSQRLSIGLVVLAAILTYANSVLNHFALDDNFIIVGNPRVHQLSNQHEIWLTPYWPGYGKALGLYRPLAIFAYALQWNAGAGAPWLFHSVSILLHAGVSVLLYALLRRLATPAGALVGALLFAVHPLHTEVVANVVGQAELLAAAAVLGACVLLAARPAGPALGHGRLLLILLLLALGMLAKEGAVVAPGLLVAIDAAQGRLQLSREHRRRYLAQMGAPLCFMATLVLAYLLLRFHVLDSIGGIDAAPNLPFLRQEHRLLSALRCWPEYMRLLFFPLDLSADYSPGVILPATRVTPMVALGALLLAGTLTLALATPWRPAAGLPAAWFFLTVLPVSNLLLPIGVLLAERILYLPSAALAFLAARAWPLVVQRTQRQRRLAPALAAALLLALAVRSAVRNPDWRTTRTVWDSLVRDHPESYRAQWIRGALVYDRGNLELARGYWELAFRIWPDDPALLNELAVAYIQSSRPDKAIPLLERSRDIAPYIQQTHTRLAFAYLSTNRYADALAAALRATRLQVDPVTTLALRAQAYEGLGRMQEAAGSWRVAVRFPQGRIWTYWAMLSRDLARVDQPAAALAAADTALVLTPRENPAGRHDLEQLRAAIARGCNFDASRHATAPPSPPTCSDPLADWAIVIPPTAKEIAITLQNATN
jgi:tetratricopeptide (TPR) repeat protein